MEPGLRSVQDTTPADSTGMSTPVQTSVGALGGEISMTRYRTGSPLEIDTAGQLMRMFTPRRTTDGEGVTVALKDAADTFAVTDRGVDE